MAINERLQQLLDNTGSSYAVLHHRETQTARETAASVQLRRREFAKVVVVGDGAAWSMVVVPAAGQIDLSELRRWTGQPGLRLAEEIELARLFPDCEVGAMPPFGALYGMAMFVDPCLLQNDDIFFSAGNHHEVVLMRRSDYQAIAIPFFAGVCLHEHPKKPTEEVVVAAH
jgi:Ala-tRNA(Pro) deacylase